MTTTATRPLTVTEAAAARGVHRDTIRRAIRHGVLVTTRTPGGHHRIDPAVLDDAFATA